LFQDSQRIAQRVFRAFSQRERPFVWHSQGVPGRGGCFPLTCDHERIRLSDVGWQLHGPIRPVRPKGQLPNQPGVMFTHRGLESQPGSFGNAHHVAFVPGYFGTGRGYPAYAL